MFPAGAERKLGERLRRALQQLRSLDLATPLQTEIVEKLLEGRRSLPELVELIYQESSGSPEYKAYYMRVRRAADHLQARGLVSTKLFGKNKPYRLTRYGVEMLTPIAGEKIRYRLLPRKDAALYSATIAVILVTIAITQAQVLEPFTVLFLGWTSCVLIGVSFCRFAEMVRKVF